MHPKERDHVRVNLRMNPKHVAIYYAAAADPGRSLASVAREFGCSREFVGQVMRKAEEIQAMPGASKEIEQALPPIEAEAVTLAGIVSVDELRERLTYRGMPAWMPAHVIVALCRRFSVPFPDSSLRKIAEHLTEVQKHAEAISRLAGFGLQAAKSIDDDAAKLEQRIRAENEPDAELVERELYQ